MWRVQTITTSALCCNVSSGSRLHVSEEAKDLVLDATVLAQVGGVKLWHLNSGGPLGNMPNEPASSLQEGGSSNLLVAEVSVDGLNLLDGPALGGQVSIVVQVLISPSAVAWHEAYSASAAASQSS